MMVSSLKIYDKHLTRCLTYSKKHTVGVPLPPVAGACKQNERSGTTKPLQSSPALQWLAARGISQAVAARYELGFLAGENGKDCHFRPRSSFGFAPKAYNGKTATKICIRRGTSIPSRVNKVRANI